jgi:hypothetical protein
MGLQTRTYHNESNPQTPRATDQIITFQILRFLEKVALMPGGRLTPREVLRSHPF